MKTNMGLADVASIGGSSAPCEICRTPTTLRLVLPSAGHIPICSGGHYVEHIERCVSERRYTTANVGSFFLAARKACGFTHEEVATKLVGVTAKNVADWEIGNASPPHWMDVFEALVELREKRPPAKRLFDAVLAYAKAYLGKESTPAETEEAANAVHAAIDVIVQARIERELAMIVRHLYDWSDEAEQISGPPQYEDALRNAAEMIERRDYRKDVAGSNPAGVSTVAGEQLPEGEGGMVPSRDAGNREERSRKSAHSSYEPPTYDGHDEFGRPDFRGFANALRAEARWSSTIHHQDPTGQAVSDQRSLNRLADHVERVGEKLNFLGPKKENGAR